MLGEYSAQLILAKIELFANIETSLREFLHWTVTRGLQELRCPNDPHDAVRISDSERSTVIASANDALFRLWILDAEFQTLDPRL